MKVGVNVIRRVSNELAGIGAAGNRNAAPVARMTNRRVTPSAELAPIVPTPSLVDARTTRHGTKRAGAIAHARSAGDWTSWAYANFRSLIASEFTTCPPIRFVA